MSNQVDLIDVKEDLKKNHSFTSSGETHFKETVNDFSSELLQRSEKIGESCRTANSPLEITHETVSTAVHSIFGAPRRQPPPSWVLPARVLEYLCAGAVGAGASNLNAFWGIPAFGIGLAIGTILIVARLMKTKED